jgi:hypothetical protein
MRHPTVRDTSGRGYPPQADASPLTRPPRLSARDGGQVTQKMGVPGLSASGGLAQRVKSDEKK